MHILLQHKRRKPFPAARKAGAGHATTFSRRADWLSAVRAARFSVFAKAGLFTRKRIFLPRKAFL